LPDFACTKFSLLMPPELPRQGIGLTAVPT
jgi:hypothetical protein